MHVMFNSRADFPLNIFFIYLRLRFMGFLTRFAFFYDLNLQAHPIHNEFKS